MMYYSSVQFDLTLSFYPRNGDLLYPTKIVSFIERALKIRRIAFNQF